MFSIYWYVQWINQNLRDPKGTLKYNIVNSNHNFINLVVE